MRLAFERLVDRAAVGDAEQAGSLLVVEISLGGDHPPEPVDLAGAPVDHDPGVVEMDLVVLDPDR